jgi:ankyrin repeat protein
MLNPQPAVIAELIRAGARVEETDGSGKTPLMLAARFTTNPLVVTTLLAAGADRRRKSPAGMTARDFAAVNHSLAGTPQLRALAALK